MMTDDEAREWVSSHHGITGLGMMERLVALVTEASASQNLVAPSTVQAMWSRHVVDSVQLLHLPGVMEHAGTWLDIGSGAGFPGLAVAGLSDRPVYLVEPRKRRAAFLQEAIISLGLTNAHVIADRVEKVQIAASIISARAVGYMGDLFSWAERCAGQETLWLLPKGRSASEEVASVRSAWHGVFHVEPSITDPASMIVLASKVARR